MSELICNFAFSEHPITIPAWALDYLLTQPLRDLFNSAASRAKHDIIPLDAEICALRHLDIGRIIRRRWIRDNDDAHHLVVLGLYRDRNGSVFPFIMIEASHTATMTEPVGERACFIEAQRPERLSGTTICSICTMFVIDKQSGQRLHLRSHLSNVRLQKLSLGCQVKVEASRFALREQMRVYFSVMRFQNGHILAALRCFDTIRANLRKSHRTAMTIAYGTRCTRVITPTKTLGSISMIDHGCAGIFIVLVSLRMIALI